MNIPKQLLTLALIAVTATPVSCAYNLLRGHINHGDDILDVKENNWDWYCNTDDDCTTPQVCVPSIDEADRKTCGCEYGTNRGCDPDSEAPYCGSAYTMTGTYCQCGDDSDCPGVKTCGSVWCISHVIPYCSVDHNADQSCEPTPSPKEMDVKSG
eukprot:CAMPEP_0172554178 /NCGR_PEP_ID=MMETSP1067-20121228/53526_1 /TAXON_ID=265564 ORGANISM="Thalassiosira punctigera, Strain Tpunct2005C2" /NCGR_SAMPLE_ID=MMETSP1067 /ASSEMBLY_ACC=CAM_ASM_000444 /LENGTH=154 /DNA_ID=CAMNT_0013342499 /DNA_START=92 /DNA_END=556 /DNA_ORIENTATION=-